MKESVDSNNRKLIRPSITEMKEQTTPKRQPAPQQKAKRSTPPDQTHAENFYYLKQMQSHTPMVLVLKDGEEIIGTIEWYDKTCLKLNREGGPNLLIYKESIKYIYKAPEKRSKPERPVGGGKSRANGSPED